MNILNDFEKKLSAVREFYRVIYMYAGEIGVADIGLHDPIELPLGATQLLELTEQIAEELVMNNSSLFHVLSWQFLGSMSLKEFRQIS